MDTSQIIAILGIFALGFLISIVIFGGTDTYANTSKKAAGDCIALCQELKSGGASLSKGPCLSNNIIEDWVCDVAHYPREFSDDALENQCVSMIEGSAHHFIEVDSDCKLIRIY